MKKQGTPKTMKQAIVNGLLEYGFVNNEKIAELVLIHVRDFMAQKAFVNETEQDIWIRVFEKTFPKKEEHTLSQALSIMMRKGA